MGESFMWIFALLILMFGGNFGGFGYGRVPGDQVTQAELQAGLNNASTQNQLQQLGIATANNNYETALLINQLGNQMTTQNNSNLVNAIQGFNAISSKLDQLGYQMENCCCSIKTQMLQDKFEKAQAELVAAQGKISNAEQTQTILSSLGRFVAWAGTGAPAASGT